MTALRFNAHAGTDILDVVDGAGDPVNHGLLTGDGPGTTLVPGGAAGGLVASDDYYVIRVDDTHVKIAASSADAMVGTAVDVTADISGVLGVGLPFRRARTYVPSTVDVAGSQIRSADLNALQDAEVKGLHGLATKIVPAQRWVEQAGQDPLSRAVGQSIGTGPGGLEALCGLEVVKGETLFEVRVRLKPDAGNVLRVRLFAIIDDDPGTVEIAGPIDTVGSAAWETVTLPNIVHDVIAGAVYVVRVSRQSGAALADGLAQVEVDSYKAA